MPASVFKFSAVIPIAWPNTTARSPEKLSQFLRKIGVLKNVNLLVGHAAILVAKHNVFIYADFGRYITPNGFGRTRTAETDPKLTLKTIPEWSASGDLLNFEEVCSELESINKATHGDGALYASIMYQLDIEKVLQTISEYQLQGYVPYSGLKKNESNCARFVATAIQAGLDRSSIIYKRFLRPSTIAPTPFFNVIAANLEGKYFIWNKGTGDWFNCKISAARTDILKKISYSFSSKRAKLLPTDARIGQLHAPDRHSSIPVSANYLGGIGEGAWHVLEKYDDSHLKKSRYFVDGYFEYENIYEVDEDWVKEFENNLVQITYDTHFSWITLLHIEWNKKKRFYARNSSYKQ